MRDVTIPCFALEQGIASGIRRTLLTRRSWGEGDLRSARHDINGATPPPIATPLRGPLRASADGVTPGRSSRSAGRRESGHERGVHSGGHQLKVVEGECSNRTTSEKARVDGVGERSSHAAAESLRADTEGHALAACSPDEAHHSTPTRFSSALCPKSDSCSTPCEGTRHAEQQDGDAGADKQGADSTPAFHTPSASMVTGYIRARQRTPQTSLGPAKRVPLAERLPTTGHDPESAERVIAKSKGGVTGESGSVPQPRFSGTSPKNLKGKGLSARKERGLEDDNVATAVADVWALTEGLRRSAQIALNASSSSGYILFYFIFLLCPCDSTALTSFCARAEAQMTLPNQGQQARLHPASLARETPPPLMRWRTCNFLLAAWISCQGLQGAHD